jgi:hypothetical protein
MLGLEEQVVPLILSQQEQMCITLAVVVVELRTISTTTMV